MGLSQEQFSEKLGISPNHLSVIETGRKFVSYTMLEKIIKTLDVSPAALFYSKTNTTFDESLQNRISTLISTELSHAQNRIQEELCTLK